MPSYISWQFPRDRSSAEVYSPARPRAHTQNAGSARDYSFCRARLESSNSKTSRGDPDAEVPVRRDGPLPNVRFEELVGPRNGHRTVLRVNQVAFSDFARGALPLGVFDSKKYVGSHESGSSTPKGTIKPSPAHNTGKLHSLEDSCSTVEELPDQVPVITDAVENNQSLPQLTPCQKASAESLSRPSRVLSSSEQCTKARELLRGLSAHGEPRCCKNNTRPSTFKGVSKVRSHAEVRTQRQTKSSATLSLPADASPTNYAVSEGDKGMIDTWDRDKMVMNAQPPCSSSSQTIPRSFTVQHRSGSSSRKISSGRISRGSVPPPLRRRGEGSSFSRSSQTCMRPSAFAPPPHPHVIGRSVGSQPLLESVYPRSADDRSDSTSPLQSDGIHSQATRIQRTTSSTGKYTGCVSSCSSGDEVSDTSSARDMYVLRSGTPTSWCADRRARRGRNGAEAPRKEALSGQPEGASLSPEAHSFPEGSLVSLQSHQTVSQRCPLRHTATKMKEPREGRYPVPHDQQMGFTSWQSANRSRDTKSTWSFELLHHSRPAPQRTSVDTSSDHINERATVQRRPVQTGSLPAAKTAAADPPRGPGLPRLSTSLSADQLPLYRDCKHSNSGRLWSRGEQLIYCSEQLTKKPELLCKRALLGRSSDGATPRRDRGELMMPGNRLATAINAHSSTRGRADPRSSISTLPSLPRWTAIREQAKSAQLGQDGSFGPAKGTDLSYSRRDKFMSESTTLSSPVIDHPKEASPGSAVFRQLDNLRQLVSQQLDRSTPASMETIQQHIQHLADSLELLHLRPPSRSSEQSGSPCLSRTSSLHASGLPRAAAGRCPVTAAVTGHSCSTRVRASRQRVALVAATREVEQTAGKGWTPTAWSNGCTTPSEAVAPLLGGSTSSFGHRQVTLAGQPRSPASCVPGPESPPASSCGLPACPGNSIPLPRGENRPSLLSESRLLARCVSQRLAQEGRTARQPQDRSPTAKQAPGFEPVSERVHRPTPTAWTKDRQAGRTSSGTSFATTSKAQPLTCTSESVPSSGPWGNARWADAGLKTEGPGTGFQQRYSSGRLKRSFTASVLGAGPFYARQERGPAGSQLEGAGGSSQVSSGPATGAEGFWPLSSVEGEAEKAPSTNLIGSGTSVHSGIAASMETGGSAWGLETRTDIRGAPQATKETSLDSDLNIPSRGFRPRCEVSPSLVWTHACATTLSAQSCFQHFASVRRHRRFARRRSRHCGLKSIGLKRRKCGELIGKAAVAGEQNKPGDGTTDNIVSSSHDDASLDSPKGSPTSRGSETDNPLGRVGSINAHPRLQETTSPGAITALLADSGSQRPVTRDTRHSESASDHDREGKSEGRQPRAILFCPGSTDAVSWPTEVMSTSARCTSADPAEVPGENNKKEKVPEAAPSEAVQQMLAEVLQLLKRQKKARRTTRTQAYTDVNRQSTCACPSVRRPRRQRQSGRRAASCGRRFLLKRSARIRRRRTESVQPLSTTGDGKLASHSQHPSKASDGVSDREGYWESDDNASDGKAPEYSVESEGTPSHRGKAFLTPGRRTARRAAERGAQKQHERRTDATGAAAGTSRQKKDGEDEGGESGRTTAPRNSRGVRGMPRHTAERAVLRTAREKVNQGENCTSPLDRKVVHSETPGNLEKRSRSSCALPPGRPESLQNTDCCRTDMPSEKRERPFSATPGRGMSDAGGASDESERFRECRGADASTDESPSQSPSASYEELFGFPDLIPEEWYADRAPSLRVCGPSREPSPLPSKRKGTENVSPSLSPTAMHDEGHWFPATELIDLQVQRDQLEKSRLESVEAGHSPSTAERRERKQGIRKEGTKRSASPDQTIPPQFPEDLLDLLGTVEDLSPSALVTSGLGMPHRGKFQLTQSSSSSDESSGSSSPSSATESDSGSKKHVAVFPTKIRSSSAMRGLQPSSDSDDSSADVSKIGLQQDGTAEHDSSCPSAASSCSSVTSGTQSLNEDAESETTSVSTDQEDQQADVNDGLSLLDASQHTSILSAVQNAPDPLTWQDSHRLPPRTPKRRRDTGCRRARSQPPSRARSLPKKAGRTQQRRRQAGLKQRLLALQSTCVTHRDYMKQFARRMCLPGIHKVACIEMTKAKRPLSVCTRNSEEPICREQDTGAEEATLSVEESAFSSTHYLPRVLTIESCVASCLRKRGWVMNKLLDTRFFDLKWKLSDVIEDYRSLRPEQLFNHFQNNRVITTKAGLARSFRLLAVEEQVRVDDFFPRCYDLSSLDDCADFLLDYSRCEAVTILLHFLRCLQATATEFREAMAQPQPETPLRHSGVLILWMAYHIVITWLHELHPDLFLDKLEGLERRPLNPQHLEVFATHAWNFRKNPAAFQREWYALAHGCGRDATAFWRKRSKAEAAVRRGFDAFKEQGISRAPPEAQILAALRQVRAGWSLWGAERGTVCLENVSSSDERGKLGKHMSTTGPRWLQHNIWIIKPSSNSRASGVYCLDSPWEILKSGRGLSDRLVQRYVERPLLLFDGRKFDLRQWVLIRSFNPLKVYAFTDLYLRLCTEAYDVSDLHNRFRHISNWNLNRLNDTVQSTSQGGPTSSPTSECSKPLAELRMALDRVTGISGFWEQHVMPQIRHIILQTAKAARPFVISRPNCFELYGFDILLDEDFRPWLIEVNLSPACTARSCWHKQMVSSMSQQLLDLLLKERLPPASSRPAAMALSLQADKDGLGQYSPVSPHWELLFDETTPPAEAAKIFPPIESAVSQGFVREKRKRNPFLQFYARPFQRTTEQQVVREQSHAGSVPSSDEGHWSGDRKKGVKPRGRTSENGEGAGRDKLMVIGVQLSRQQEADLDFWVRIAESRCRIIRWWRQTAWRRRAARRRKMRVHADIELDVCFP